MFVLVSKSTLDNLGGYGFSDHTSLMVKSSELTGPRESKAGANRVSPGVPGQGLWFGEASPKHGSCTTDAQGMVPRGYTKGDSLNLHFIDHVSG